MPIPLYLHLSHYNHLNKIQNSKIQNIFIIGPNVQAIVNGKYNICDAYRNIYKSTLY